MPENVCSIVFWEAEIYVDDSLCHSFANATKMLAWSMRVRACACIYASDHSFSIIKYFNATFLLTSELQAESSTPERQNNTRDPKQIPPWNESELSIPEESIRYTPSLYSPVTSVISISISSSMQSSRTIWNQKQVSNMPAIRRVHGMAHVCAMHASLIVEVKWNVLP